jgi:hypothetical protein
MDRFCSKIVSFLLSVIYTTLYKHTSLLQYPYITNLYCFVVQAPDVSEKAILVVWLGNCNIRAVQKISFTNELKQYEIQPRPKGWVQKISRTLPANFIKGFCKSWLKFCQFCMDEREFPRTVSMFENVLFPGLNPALVLISGCRHQGYLWPPAWLRHHSPRDSPLPAGVNATDLLFIVTAPAWNKLECLSREY